MTPKAMIDSYIALRNKVAEIKQKHEEELGQYKNVMAQIEVALLQHLDAANLDAVKCDTGTAFKQTSTSVSVSDWQSALDYIIANEKWELLEARVAKNAALTTIAETKAPVPGVTVSQAIVLRVRAS